MDNSNASKIPVSELTPENIDSLKGSAPVPREPNKLRNRNKIPFLIAGVVLLVGVGVGLYFIFRPNNNQETPAQEEEETVDTEVIWQAPEGSEDPAGDYVAHQQEIIESTEATDDEKLTAQLSTANLYSVLDRFDEAQAVLDAISRDGLTHRQLFNLYSAYVYLYQHNGDETSELKYSALVEEVLGQLWDDEAVSAEVNKNSDEGTEGE